MRFHQILAAAFLFTFFAGCGENKSDPTAPPLTYAPEEETRLSLPQGDIIGAFGRDGAHAWYGVPFAAPPLGDLRWRAPRPAEEWTGELQATNAFNRCTQYANGVEPGYEDGDLAGKEDCLYLNIWAPADRGDEPLPVMVWIHGGANVWGYAGQYEMGRMAETANVVVVGVNYRLAMMGWFAHPSIVETAETERDKSMNFGILDQIAALEWVQNNINYFGGDANNVTIFGQSAGAFNVAALLSSPLTDGLFHKAIVQSGGLRSATYKEAVYGPDDEATRRGSSSTDLIDYLVENDTVPSEISGAALAKRLREMSAKDLFEAYSELPNGFAVAGPVNPVDITGDGVAVPDAGIRDSLFTSDTMRDVPLMIGTTKDEFKGAAFINGGMVHNFFNIAFWPKDKRFYSAYGYYPNEAWSYHGVQEIAEHWNKQQTEPVYTYRFDWDEQGKAFVTDISFLFGASHALEIPFVTGGFDDRVGDPLGIYFNDKNKQGREKLSTQMMDYWAAFAHTGSPGNGLSGDYPTWKDWSPEAEKLFIFDTEQDGGLRMTNETLDAEALFDQFLTDKRFKNTPQRCETAEMVHDVLNIVGGDLSRWQNFTAENCEPS